MNYIKNRGAKDILMIYAIGRRGIKEAIAAAFPKTEYQRCIFLHGRNKMKHVASKERKLFFTDQKMII